MIHIKSTVSGAITLLLLPFRQCLFVDLVSFPSRLTFVLSSFFFLANHFCFCFNFPNGSPHSVFARLHLGYEPIWR